MVTGIVPETLALQVSTQSPDRKLMADDDGFVSDCRDACGIDGCEHAMGDLQVGLAPGRGERVTQFPPVTRTRERTVPDGNLETLELVACLDQVFVRDDVELVCLGDRSRG